MTISQMRRSVPRSWPKPRPETWGVSSTFSMPQSGEEGGSGSVSHTSSTAPLRWPSARTAATMWT